MLRLHHDFTFNPDGSGRVLVRWTGPGGPGAPASNDFVRSELERAHGVAAWADVTCETVDEQLVFSAVAWFDDVRALRFHCQGFHVNLLDFEVVPGDDGAVTIRSLPAEPTGTTIVLPADASPAVLRATIASEREKLAPAREFLAGMFGELECTAVLRAPGPLVGKTPGERIDERTVRVHFLGSKLVEIVDRLLTDDALMTKLLRSGGVTPQAALELLGDQGPIVLVTSPGAEAQFDYQGEVAGARDAFPALAEQLGAEVPQELPAEPLANVRVVASKIVFEADGDRDLCPQGQNFAGVQLTIAGDLPQPCLDIDEARLTRAIAADGTDLLPRDDWDRRCHFPKRTNDGRTVYFDLGLPLPTGSHGLAALHGRVDCLLSSGEEALDLGFPEFVAGATGTVFGAQLLRADLEEDDRWQIEVQLQVARQRVLACALQRGDEAVPLEQTGYSSSGDECSISWRGTGPLPADARLVVTFASDLARAPFGFELADIDWFGRPL